jgi:phage terminase large subunit
MFGWETTHARSRVAYFAQVLNEARQQGRIGKVSADPILPIRLFWDIGGAGAKADACAIWVVQWVAQEIRVLDYIEGQGQVLGSTPTSSDIAVMTRRSASCRTTG